MQPQKPLGRSSSMPAAQSGVQTDGELVVGLAFYPRIQGKIETGPQYLSMFGHSVSKSVDFTRPIHCFAFS